jgi:predicted Zn-ribbon and HTH transcriptional regulator
MNNSGKYEPKNSMTVKTVGQTIRQQMVTVLSEGPHSARDLSKILHIREKEVHDHLNHIARSLSPRKKALVTVPYGCLKCGYVFENRKRFTRPSRCPKCRGERIEEPVFQIA